MPHEPQHQRRLLVVQLARLGDVVQTLPTIAALKKQCADATIDLLCAAPLIPIASVIPQVERAVPWDGPSWRTWATEDQPLSSTRLQNVRNILTQLAPHPYDVAYNLNQHPRSVFASHLLANRVIGPGQQGPLATDLPPWPAYLRRVAAARHANRVHLADAFCGICGVRPLGEPSHMAPPKVSLPDDLDRVGRDSASWVALVVGASEMDRLVPIQVWRSLVIQYLRQYSAGRMILLGGKGERERAIAIQHNLPFDVFRRVSNASGRTDLGQAAMLLSRCRWVIGADTGPLHLGTAVGTRAMGFYFSRARVHETGPYGIGHLVWQADHPAPADWPVESAVRILLGDSPLSSSVDGGGWSLWQSTLDRWGTAYFPFGGEVPSNEERARVWRELAPAQSVFETPITQSA